MPTRDEIRDQIRQKIREQLAAQRPQKKSFGGFVGNLKNDITGFAKGIVGLGYNAVRHPINSTKAVLGVGGEIVKGIPNAAKSMVHDTIHFGETTRKGIDAFKQLRNVSYQDQSKFWEQARNKMAQTPDGGKKNLAILGSGLIEDISKLISHPAESGYNKPFTAALNVIPAAKATGVSKVVTKPLSKAGSTIAKTEKGTALIDAFSPGYKLRKMGYGQFADNLSSARSAVREVPQKIVEATGKKFKPLSEAERTDFFNTIDTLRRSKDVAKSSNPKVQALIDWWIKKENPKLRKSAGVKDGEGIENYLHHLFPEKKTGLSPSGKPQRGYLKKSKDIEGYSKDPILSISAVKSKVAVDNIKNTLITKTIKRYGRTFDDFLKQLKEMHGAEQVAKWKNEGRLGEIIKKNFNVESYTPGKNVKGIKNQEYFIPKEIHEAMTKFAQGGKKSVLDMLMTPLDVFNRNWKPLATAVRPRYHLRNIVGNTYNASFIGGANPLRFGTAFKEQLTKGKYYNLAKKKGVIGRGFFGADVNDLASASIKGEDLIKTIKNVDSPAEIYKVPLLKQWLKGSQKVGSAIEDNARLALFIDRLKKGSSVKEAKAYVNKHLFDYLEGLGDADRQIKRVIPFWSWTRFNTPLQVEALGKIPFRNLAAKQGTSGMVAYNEQTDEGYKYLTDKEKEMGAFKVGEATKNGKTYDKYIRTQNVLPSSDLVTLLNKMQGEDTGVSPIFNILKQIKNRAIDPENPDDNKNYFGSPVEKFAGEDTRFLGLKTRGTTKEALSSIPALTEINKLFGGSYNAKERPSRGERAATVLSPVSQFLADKDKNQQMRAIETNKKLKGQFEGGLQSLYTYYLRKGVDDNIAKSNAKKIENILKDNGYSDEEILKLKIKAIKAIVKEKTLAQLQ